jgi:hypothetical protein
MPLLQINTPQPWQHRGESRCIAKPTVYQRQWELDATISITRELGKCLAITHPITTHFTWHTLQKSYLETLWVSFKANDTSLGSVEEV